MEDRQTTVEKFRSACEEGNFETALQLIGSGECRPGRLLKGGYCCLHYAAAHGKLDVVRTLIEKYRCNPNSTSGRRQGCYTSLHFACYYGHIDVVKYLVREQKCNPYRLNKEGFTPLRYALNADPLYVPLHSQAVQDARYFEIVKFLVLECPCILSRHGKLTALSRILHMACRYGTLEDIKCFIGKGLKVQACIAKLKDCHPKEYDIPRYQRNPITYNTLVHVACMNGRLEVVKYLIENEHCDPQECNSDGDNAVHIACRNGNFEVLKYLLEEQKLELTICNTLGNTLLHLVCMNEHLESATVEYLIEKGCKPNIENKCGELPLYLACQNQSLDIIKLVSAFTKLPEAEVKTTPVHIACSKGSLETVQHLVKERHWNPKCEDSNGLTPLHHACGYKSSHTHGHHGQLRRVVNLELVLFLVKECGCDPMKSINPPIALACEECDVELVKALISSDVNCRDSSGNSPLHLACKYKAKKILRYLIEEAKCDPTIQNSMGELPLHIACEQTSLEMVKLVSDCNVNSRTVDGDTPLHIACEHGALDIARYLIQIKGCSPPQHREIYHNLCIHATCESEDMTLIKSIATPENVNNFCTYTLDNYERFESFESYESFESFEADAPLHIACKNGKLELVQFLVQEMNASVSVVNGNKKLPLHFACIHDSLEMVQLVSGCEDVDRKDSQGDTSLHIACRCGNFDIAKYLIMKRKCDPTIRNSNEELPLHYACMHSLEMVRFIIDVCQQSLVSTTTDKGATPLHFACLYGKLEVVKFLTEEREANPSVHDKKGLTPLHYACGICSYSNPDPIDSESMAAIAKYLVIRHECNPLENKNTVYQYYMDRNYSPLEKAVVEGNLELVKALTSGNLNIDYLNSSGESMLHEACAHHQHDIVEFLVTGRYCNQEVQNRSGQTALHIACRTGCLDTVRLVSSNCDVNMQTIDDDTPLHIACQHCHISITKFLTEVRRSNLSIPNSQGEMALHIACKQNSLALVKLCSNCDVNTKSQDEDTPLHIALKRRQEQHVAMQGYQIVRYLVTEKRSSRHFDVDENEQIVKYLVNEKQCDLSLLDKYGCLPLHIACQCDSLALVKLVSNCNVNATTKKGDTPLHTVIQRIKEHVDLKENPKEGYEIVQYLVSEKHCNLILPDENGCIPLHIACGARTHDIPLHIVLKEKNVMESIIKVLVGVDGSIVNVCNKDGNTPLHLVCGDLHSQHAIGFRSFLPSSDHRPDHLVECLIGDNARCDVSITNSTNKSALHLACATPRMPLKVIELLLSRSTSSLCNSKDHLGDTPLHIACRRTSPTFADYLVKSQLCDADIQNNEEELPLHIACRNFTLSFNSVIKMLSCQCRLNCTNKTGDTPLHILCRIGNFEAIQELVFIQHCDTDIQNLDGEVPLHLAIDCSFNQKIVELVGAHCHHSPNIQTKSGDTPLHIACKHGKLHAIEYLTERMHCDPSIQNKSGLLPLHYASHHSVAVARLVRDCDPNLQCITEHEFKYPIEGKWNTPTCRIETGDTPLHVACRNRRLKMISFLVKEMKCNVNVPNSNEETPLHVVCHSGLSSLNILKLVKRCKPNAQTKCGDTPLHIAVHHASTSTIKYLVKQMKCNVNIPNKNGQLPLHLLLHQGSKEDAIPLVVNSLNVNSKDEHGNAPLHTACLKFSRETIEYLSKIKGCDLNITNNDGDLPLHVVCRMCMYDNQLLGLQDWFIVIKLMSASNVNTRNSAGNTPLHEACQLHFNKIVQHLILEKNCNPSICNEQHELPLHLASRRCSLEIVKLVSGVDDVNSQTISGNTPLHEACQFGYSKECVETVQHLILEKNCNPSICNEQHELPLHLACRKCSLEIVKLVSGVDDVNSQTISGNTPLHEACQFEEKHGYSICAKTVQHLILEKNCNPSICNEQHELPLHLACRKCSLEIVKLVSRVDDVNSQTISGNTPLHEACQFEEKYDYSNKCVETVQHLILEKNCNPSICNEQHELPLHLACRKCSLEIVKLVSGVDDVNSQTTSGNTPLHEACQFESESGYRNECLETVQHLILEKNCNPSICNKQYELPLHLASRRGSLEIVKLVSKVDDMNLQTLSGNTPLHEACMSTFYRLKELLEFLIEKGCKTKCQNDVGKTPLHCLCESRSSTTAIEYLLSISKSELSVADNEGQTPIMLTTNLSITKILLKHGADATPLYEMHRAFFKNKTPPPTPLNVLVVGNASMGKTTLIESLKNEVCETVVAEPQLHTAGIIPNDFESKLYGSVIFYDFAGQHEYYASHEAVVHNIIKHSPPVILLVINITEPKNEMWKKLAYWTVLIEGRCTTLREKPHLIVVGSHLDQVKETDCSNAEENLRLLTASLQSKLEKSPLRFITHVAMDCRQSQSSRIEKLRHILQKSSAKLRGNAVMNFNCHCFCVFLQDKLNHFTALPVERVANAIISYGRQRLYTSVTGNLLSPNTQDVARICEELSNMGHLLFLKNHSRLEMSWVILKKERLLSTVNGTVFAPHSFKQHTDLSSSTGVVPFQKIATYFPRYDPNMIVGFLSHLEFCQEIHDQEVLDLLAPYDRATGPHSSTQRYFFFPRLVSIETPRGVWKSDQNYGYQWGWMLYCTNSEEFFTPHFLQVLILRLAFSFALTAPPKRPDLDEIPAIKRACSVWKKGICWTATAGIEATVEVIEQNQAVVAMVRSYKKIVSEVECIQLRSSIMRKVLQAKQTFCPNVSTAESFIHPKHLCYPLPCIREMNLFSLPIVARAIVQIDPCAVNESGELLSIDELICFEPYSCLGESMLQKLFNQENAETIVTDGFLQNMAGAIVENTDDHTTREFKRKVFMKVFKISPVAIKEATHDSDLETERLFGIFQAWCSHSDGTYQCLRQKLDDFSLFHGRNPLVSIEDYFLLNSYAIL